MNKKQDKKAKSVSIRFPVELLEELRTVAQEHHRSLNGEVLTILSDFLKSRRQEQHD